MSSMLEQAIIDAAMLREAALKNAEQSLIEKYAPQIKEAVDAMLEGETVNERHCGSKARHKDGIVEIIDGINETGHYTVQPSEGKAYLALSEELTDLTEEDILQEEEAAPSAPSAGGSSIEMPFAGDTSIPDDQEVQFTMETESTPDFIEIDLGALRKELGASDTDGDTDRDDMADELKSIDDLMGDLDLDTEEPADTEAETADAPDQEEDNEMDDMLQELLSLLSEDEEVLEEKFVADMGEEKDGTFQSFGPTLEYYKEMEDANEASKASGRPGESTDEDVEELEEEEETGKVSNLHETISALAAQNEKLESVIYQLSDTLEETLLSNAKLIYQNRTLSDASLNERQKSKIVEAIAAAESPKEAKQLHETLKATVGSNSGKSGPQSLSESVNRRSNLSSMLNTRQNLSENKSADPFMEKMQKLAGIK